MRAVDTIDLVDQTTLFAFDPRFSGGVRVAGGDFNRDGLEDIVAAAGSGGGPHVRVFDGQTRAELRNFYAYGPTFSGGVFVAAGDVNGDGTPDIITGAGAGGGPHVRVLSGVDGTQLHSFFAYAPNFVGGVTVAAGDVNGDGKADIITGPGASGGPHVRVFSGANLAELRGFFAYASNFTGGIFVAGGDINADGKADIITGAGATGGPHVRVFSGANQSELMNFFAYAPQFTGGVRVAAGDVNFDGRTDIVTGPGPGGGPHVRAFNSAGAELISFFAYSPQFTGGTFVSSASAVDPLPSARYFQGTLPAPVTVAYTSSTGQSVSVQAHPGFIEVLFHPGVTQSAATNLIETTALGLGPVAVTEPVATALPGLGIYWAQVAPGQEAQFINVARTSSLVADVFPLSPVELAAELPNPLIDVAPAACGCLALASSTTGLPAHVIDVTSGVPAGPITSRAVISDDYRDLESDGRADGISHGTKVFGAAPDCRTTVSRTGVGVQEYQAVRDNLRRAILAKTAWGAASTGQVAVVNDSWGYNTRGEAARTDTFNYWVGQLQALQALPTGIRRHLVLVQSLSNSGILVDAEIARLTAQFSRCHSECYLRWLAHTGLRHCPRYAPRHGSESGTAEWHDAWRGFGRTCYLRAPLAAGTRNLVRRPASHVPRGSIGGNAPAPHGT